MDPSSDKFRHIRYVITEDSLTVDRPAWNTLIFKATVITLSLAAIAVVCLYFAGIVVGSSAVQEITEKELSIVEFDGSDDPLCLSYSIVTEHCSDITLDEIGRNGCKSYVERSGGICVSYDKTRTLCIVNYECDLVDTSRLTALRTGVVEKLACKSYSIIVNSCADVSVEEIAQNGCMSYVDGTGVVCGSSKDTEKLCVANNDCDLVDISVL